MHLSRKKAPAGKVSGREGRRRSRERTTTCKMLVEQSSSLVGETSHRFMLLALLVLAS
jgi:hypothetical protein